MRGIAATLIVFVFASSAPLASAQEFETPFGICQDFLRERPFKLKTAYFRSVLVELRKQMPQREAYRVATCKVRVIEALRESTTLACLNGEFVGEAGLDRAEEFYTQIARGDAYCRSMEGEEPNEEQEVSLAVN